MHCAIEPVIANDLDRKMVFVAGPRQVGKTTVARTIVGDRSLNWDIADDRERILRGQWPPGGEAWALDELHRYRRRVAPAFTLLDSAPSVV